MKSIQVFDKPMCCSTGICGPDVDPTLPRFAADLDWLQSIGNRVERFNLGQQPMAFIENKQIHQLLSSLGTDCLPVIIIDDQIVSQSVYPSRTDFSKWIEGRSSEPQMLPVVKTDNCCGSNGCC